MGSGLDLTEDGQIQLSCQIAIPSGVGGGQDSGGGGTKKESFRVISATGKNVYDAVTNLQSQLSRGLFIGQRKIILIGQRLAEHGISELLDEFLRNPQSEMRARIYVVKDGQAKDIFMAEPIFDPFTTVELLQQQATLGLKHYYFRDFLSDAFSEESQPLSPAVSLSSLKHPVYSGTAVFNKADHLKLEGFLNAEESSYANWITDKQTVLNITSLIPQGKGNVTLKMQSLGQRIQVKMVNERIKMDVHLTGKGTIVENNTNLDPTNKKDLHIIQDELSQTTQKSIERLIEKVKKQYKIDIFGFGESVHRQYPNQWRTLKRNWNDTFTELQITVKVQLQIEDSGQSKSSTIKMP
jgi:spore germination protein KC